MLKENAIKNSSSYSLKIKIYVYALSQIYACAPQFAKLLRFPRAIRIFSRCSLVLCILLLFPFLVCSLHQTHTACVYISPPIIATYLNTALLIYEYLPLPFFRNHNHTYSCYIRRVPCVWHLCISFSYDNIYYMTVSYNSQI